MGKWSRVPAMRGLPRQLKAPEVAVKPRIFRTHGDERTDEYAWLQDASSPAVRAHIAAENTYADKVMAGTGKLQKQLYTEIRKRMIEDDMSVPIKRGPYYYYLRTKKGKQYAIHCRKLGKHGKEEVILDENALARGKPFFALGSIEVSPDQRLLAYSIDTKGDERYTLHIKNLKTKRTLAERIRSADGLVWSADSEYLFYALEEHPFPPRKIYRHKVGTPSDQDKLVYAEKDKQWYVGIADGASKRFMYIHAGNFDTNECWYIPTDAPLSEPKLFAKRKKHVKYSVEDWEDYFYIVTNERAVNYKIMRTTLSEPQQKHWKPWLSHNPKRAITGFMPFRTFCALTIRDKGTEELFITHGSSKQLKKVILPEETHSISVTPELEYESPLIQFAYQSFVTPTTVFEYTVSSGELVERKHKKVPGWKPDQFVTKRIWVKSGAVRVPVSLVYPASSLKKGPIPFLLDFYGSYGYPNDPYFSISRLSLLRRGWGMAIAHVRGGGDMGWNWHETARRTTKHRTYQDVVAVADALVAKKYTARDRLFLTGGSAGGMTLGAVLNMRPDICAGGICYVPDADTVTTSLDTSLGGTLLHYDELGDPRKKKEYLYLKRWSPYENIKKAPYPTLLVRASMFDIRTPYWEAAKWVARMRARTTSDNPLLLKTESNAGHGGKSGRYEWIKERAYDYAFLIASVAGMRSR